MDFDPTDETTDSRKSDAKDDSSPGIGGAGAAPEKLLMVKEVLGNVLEKLGASVEFQVSDGLEAIECRIDPHPDDRIFEQPGRRQLVEAIQFLVNRIVNREPEERKWVAIGVGEDVSTGDQAVEVAVKRLAASVRRMKKTLTVVGMEARHRRILHLSMGEEEGIQARSEGDGPLRRVVLEAKEEE